MKVCVKCKFGKLIGMDYHPFCAKTETIKCRVEPACDLFEYAKGEEPINHKSFVQVTAKPTGNFLHNRHLQQMGGELTDNSSQVFWR